MLSTLRYEPYNMPAANLGKNNPLPDLRATADLHAAIQFDETIPEEERASFSYGRVYGILPYLLQDGYDRNKKPRDFNAVILENDHLKAVFIPELGGRLWSLFDKDAGRELLHVNPVFQPANLALRNAWISGGVEWNIGMIGHTPFTVSPLFYTDYEMTDGTPVLRMYEWERIRRASYQIDAYLPKGSKYLYVRVQIVNTRDEEVPMYWWSNIAVDEGEDVRVLAPADKAFAFDYTRVLTKTEVPYRNEKDTSYTTRIPHAMDLFYDIQNNQRKWECVVGKSGYGFIHASTDRLRGRKLFMWGNSIGGKRWQDFLAAPGHAYLEVQAGIAQTQMQCLPMPARAKWDWLEAYGAIKTKPDLTHGNWKTAYTHVTSVLDGDLPMDNLNNEYNRINREVSNLVEPKGHGSGWAALEAARHKKINKEFDTGSAVFPEASMGPEQQPWLALLNTGVFPEANTEDEPASYMIGAEWLSMLEESVKSNKSDHWYAWLQLGVLYYANKQNDKAYSAFLKSLEKKQNAWALRNMAALKSGQDEKKESAELMLKAANLLKQVNIVIECCRALAKAEMYDDFVNFERSLDDKFRNHGRIQVLKIETLIKMGELEQAKEVFNAGITVIDMREGEVLLSDLWIMLHKGLMIKETPGSEPTDQNVLEKYPLPAEIDFRMRV